MSTTINPRSGFARVATILTALAVMLSLGVFASPAPSLAAGETALLMRVHVTNYQHGNNLQGAVVHAIGTSAIDQYNNCHILGGIEEKMATDFGSSTPV